MDITTYGLAASAAKPRLYHVTVDGVTPPPERLEIEVEQITGLQLILGRGVVIAVAYETRRAGLLSPS